MCWRRLPRGAHGATELANGLVALVATLPELVGRIIGEEKGMIRTDRRTAEREHERRYRQLVELAPDGIVIHDGERIVLANAAALRLIGATHRDQVVGKPIETFLDPPYLKAVQRQRDTLRRLDGSTLEVEMRTIAFMDRDRPSVQLVMWDISARLAAEERVRQAEERLHQAQRMEAVGALAGGVAHEINNMMSVVLGFSDFLLRDPDLPDPLRQDARHISRAAQRAATVTGQLLSFSRRAFHEPKVIDLAAAVGESEPLIRRLLGEGRLLVLVARASPHVRIDQRQLDQVIVNLALNARDAMPVEGTLTMMTEEVELKHGVAMAGRVPIPAGRYGVLVMRDTGLGMDGATQARVFEPFFTTKPTGEGSGLGLAASVGIVNQNHGYISVASAAGEGATFSVYLPVVTEAVANERRAWARPSPGKARPAGGTVLLVEDEPDVRAAAARILTFAGLTILEAPNGAVALGLADQHGPPDLVLTDVVMPGMSGPELARQLRARWPALSVLFMSGYSTEDLRHQGALDSEEITIPKPFNLDSLVRSVTAALSSNHSERSTRP